jgi:hypothetical protein
MNTKGLIYCSKTLLIAGVSCLLIQSANATQFMADGFSYASGSQLSSDLPWSGGGSQVTVGSANLTYPGVTDLGGNDLTITSGVTAGGPWVNFNGTPVTSGTVYFSFLLQATTLPTGNNEIMDLLPSGATGLAGSTAPLAIYVGQQTLGSTYKIGVRHGLSGATYATSAATTLGTVNLIVVGYTFVPGVGNDTVSLWLNPGSLGAGAPPAADVSFSNAGLADAANLQVLAVKAQSNAAQGNWNLDSFVVADTWAEVTGYTAVPEPSTWALVGSGLALMFGMIRRRRS